MSRPPYLLIIITSETDVTDITDITDTDMISQR